MKIKQRAQQQLADNVRFQALVIIYDVMIEDEYSNIRLQKAIDQHLVASKDQGLLVRIVYGTIQHYNYLAYQVDQLTQDKQVDPWVKVLLMMSLYQLLHLDRVPDHAVINEAVQIAKTNGHGGLGNFVNAILRRFQREGAVDIPKDFPTYQQWVLQYSIQEELIDLLCQQRTDAEIEALLESLNHPPHVSIRVNSKLASRDQVKLALLDDGIHAENSQVSPNGLRLVEGNVVQSSAYLDGHVIVQDESSMLVAPLGKLQGHEKVLDACSAPGGKATHIATLLDQGSVLALDVSEAKLQKVQDHAQRMGLTPWLSCQVADASQVERGQVGQFDRIYVDAPCSGLGLMRRKPEIKYKKAIQDILALQEIQEKILENMYTLLAPGGILVYSTCTLSLEENEQVLQGWLKNHPDMTIDPILPEETLAKRSLTSQGFLRIWPDHYHTDGFFIARMKKESPSDSN